MHALGAELLTSNDQMWAVLDMDRQIWLGDVQ